jgi:hypothetical protein
MYVYVCIHMIVCMYLCMYECICMYSHMMYICINVCMYMYGVCTYVCICTCMYVRMHAFMCVCMYECMYIRIPRPSGIGSFFRFNSRICARIAELLPKPAHAVSEAEAAMEPLLCLGGYVEKRLWESLAASSCGLACIKAEISTSSSEFARRRFALTAHGSTHAHWRGG